MSGCLGCCSTLSLQWLFSPTNVAWQQEGSTAKSTFGRAAKKHIIIVFLQDVGHSFEQVDACTFKSFASQAQVVQSCPCMHNL